MEIEFDPAKDALNLAKHGVSLILGAAVLTGRIGEIEDDRHAYGETRVSVFGLVAGRLFCCTCTRRGAVIRIISVRKANRKEQDRWRP